MTPPRVEPMPKTIEQHIANAFIYQALIDELVEQACKDSQTINKLRQKLHKGKL